MPAERLDTLVSVLDVIRREGGITQPQLIRQIGLGRSILAQRVSELDAAGLIAGDGLGPSTGGRAPRRYRLRAEAGIVAGADIGATGMVVGLADIAGNVLAKADEPINVADGPDIVLTRVETLLEKLISRLQPAQPLWGIGIGVPGPVEFATGLPVAPPIMPGWDGYPIRERFARRFAAPVWVDNDVNLLALGELRTNPSAAAADMLCVKIGTGIGAGLVSGGRLHRGANGAAGDIGHIRVADAGDIACRCGKAGCLEAAAGGGALARDGLELAENGISPGLADLLAASGTITAVDVILAATGGDPAALDLLTKAGRLIGTTLATLVSFYNPGLMVVGGGVGSAGDFLLDAIRESVYRESLPLATRTLRIQRSALGHSAGLTGAVHLVLDALFAVEQLPRWLPAGSPAGLTELV